MQPPIGITSQGKPRTCGLRLSVVDGVVLAAAVVATVATYPYTFGYSPLILFVVLHFFLFCNVFRIRRQPELIWGGVLIVNCLAWIVAGRLSLTGLCATPAIATMVIIAYELGVPTYHGIFARRINPRIDDYLAGRM